VGNKIKMENTGERFIPSEGIQNIIQLEHYHRYYAIKNLLEDKVVLDIASGEGYGSYFMSKYAKKIIGVDISSETVEHAKNKYSNENLEFIEGDVTEIPLDKNIFDVVVSFETLEHHDKHEEMLSEVSRVLKKDGILIISTPDKINFNKTYDQDNEYHIKELEKEEFESLMKKFFSYTRFFFQKITYGSLITGTDEKVSSEILNVNNDFGDTFKPIYNICIASNMKNNSSISSFFDGIDVYQMQIDKLENEILAIRKSLTWKLGRAILIPVSLIKKMF